MTRRESSVNVRPGVAVRVIAVSALREKRHELERWKRDGLIEERSVLFAIDVLDELIARGEQ